MAVDGDPFESLKPSLGRAAQATGTSFVVLRRVLAVSPSAKTCSAMRRQGQGQKHQRTRLGATSAMTHLKPIMMTNAARSRRSRPRRQGPVGPTDQAPLSTLRDRVVSDPGLVIPAVGCHRESAGSQVEIPLKCCVLSAVHQGFNALSSSGGIWSVVAAVLVSLLFQS